MPDIFRAEIYHLACPASPPHYQINAVKTLKTSFQGTLNMLGLAKRTKARFLITSTSGMSCACARASLSPSLILCLQRCTVTPRCTPNTRTSELFSSGLIDARCTGGSLKPPAHPSTARNRRSRHRNFAAVHTSRSSLHL